MSKGSNVKKATQLGMPYGTACARLRKMVLFELLKKLGEDICYRCGKKIKDIESLSMEHKKAWLDNDTKLFWDLNNVSFSHLSCNNLHKRFTRSSVGYAHNRGENKPSSVLKEKDVIEIRRLIRNGKNTREVSAQFGITKKHIWQIISGRRWGYIT